MAKTASEIEKQADLERREALLDERLAARLDRSLDGDPSDHFQPLDDFLAERGL